MPYENYYNPPDDDFDRDEWEEGYDEEMEWRRDAEWEEN